MGKELVLPADQMKEFLETGKKPPIGLMPREIHEAHRLHEIEDAIKRYLTAEKEIPAVWLEEYNELVRRRTNK